MRKERARTLFTNTMYRAANKTRKDRRQQASRQTHSVWIQILTKASPSKKKKKKKSKKEMKKQKKKKKFTQSQIDRCKIIVKVMNNRGEYETHHKTMEIQAYIHAFIIRKLQICYILVLNNLWSCVLKLISVLHDVLLAGIEFQRDAPAKEKLVLNRSILGLGSIMDRDG